MTYRPLGGPIGFTIDTTGEVSISLGHEFLTPIGTFEVSAEISTDAVSDDETLLTITPATNGQTKGEAYAIKARDTMTVCTNGRFETTITGQRYDLKAKDSASSVAVLPGDVSCDFFDDPSRPSATPAESRTAVPPTPKPAAGTLLCRPTAGDWPQTTDWQTVGSEYVNRTGNTAPIVAPCELSTADYAVDATIQPTKTETGTWSPVGIVARFDRQDQSGYRGGFYRQTFCGECGHGELVDLLNSHSESAEFGTFVDDAVYRLRLVLRGTVQQLYLNGELVLKEHYTSANSAGEVGIECDRPCILSAFKVVAL